LKFYFIFLTIPLFPSTSIKSLSLKYLEKEDDGIYLYSNELLNLFDGKKIEREIINERKKCYAIKRDNNILIKYSHETALKLLDDFTKPCESTKIKGIIANKGKVRGKVVVAPMLTNIREVNKIISKMEDGNILVAHSTTPELMVLINKAAAIVADQGGMLSHAAVVSREFNIPCIIGTGNATKILKDGDLIEVDANKGIVRKI
jgi:phosphoenolpyruvate synthase/pyruvate phosphate dikinase